MSTVHDDISRYIQRVTQLNGAPPGATSFSVAPSVGTRFVTRLQQSSDFLGKINMPVVSDVAGRALYAIVGTTLAGRTDTTTGGLRQPVAAAVDIASTYMCQQVNFDFVVPYSLLDAWGGDKFQTMVRDHVNKLISRDLLQMGWHGKTASMTTDRVAHPDLSDVCVGWIQRIVDADPGRVMDAPTIGTGGTWATLDEAVADLCGIVGDPWIASPGLRVLLGRGMIQSKFAPILAAATTAQEAVAASKLDLIQPNVMIGGLQPIVVPSLPAGTIMVCDPAALSIYTHGASMRQTVIDDAPRNGMAYYRSMLIDYVVEDYRACAVATNVTMV